MFPTNQEESQKLIEIGEDFKVVGLIHLSRPLILGLLISWEEQYKKMKGDELDKCFETGLAKIKELDEEKLNEERKVRFYDQRIIKPWMMI